MDTRTHTIQAKPTNSSGLQTLQISHFLNMGGLGGCPLNLNRQADGSEMSRKRKKHKPLLSKLEQDVAILHRHKFELESVEEMRQSLLKQFITHSELTSSQKTAIHALAAPLRNKSKTIRTDRRRRKHYVYAISDGAFVKIGLAVDPQKRLSDLQVANPSNLKLEAKIECCRYGVASKLEKQLHRACKKHHVRGEWFEMDAMCVFDKFS